MHYIWGEQMSTTSQILKVIKMEKKQLTDRQEEILNFIQQFLQENGYPPTLREIGKRFDISSTFGVKRHLEALTKPGQARSRVSSSSRLLLRPGTSPGFVECFKSFG